MRVVCACRQFDGRLDTRARVGTCMRPFTLRGLACRSEGRAEPDGVFTARIADLRPRGTHSPGVHARGASPAGKWSVRSFNSAFIAAYKHESLDNASVQSFIIAFVLLELILTFIYIQCGIEVHTSVRGRSLCLSARLKSAPLAGVRNRSARTGCCGSVPCRRLAVFVCRRGEGRSRAVFGLEAGCEQ